MGILRGVVLFGALAIIVGCMDGGANSAPPESAAPPIQPPAPSPPYDSTQDTTVKGRDEDDNGIRDDIDDLLFERYGNRSDNIRFHIGQIASIFQEKLTSNGNREELLGLISRSGDHIYCIRLLDPELSAEIHDYLAAQYINTQMREDAYRNFLASAGGFITLEKLDCNSLPQP